MRAKSVCVSNQKLRMIRSVKYQILIAIIIANPHDTKYALAIDSHLTLFLAGATHAGQIRVREQIRMTLKTP
jgi:hypothetical protein